MAAGSGYVSLMNSTVQSLLERCGQTYAEEAGIRLADKPAPLYQLLVLTVLLSTRIRAKVAVAAAQELFRDGCTTPRRMLEATWHQRVAALGRAHYVRYDESTATALEKGAHLLLDRYAGDLRRVRQTAGGDLERLRNLLQEVPRIGPVGAEIFCREAQAVWPELRPYFDRRALAGAELLGLPATATSLSSLVSPDRLASLAAALVRVTLDPHLAAQVKDDS
jgi:endonuclease III